MDRKAQSHLHQRRSRVRRRAQATQAVEFFNILTSPELLETTEALQPEHRERLYPPTVALSMLMRQTPQMNDKQMWVHLLAYNVIRLLMAQAASQAGIEPRDLSFKHTVQLWTEWVARGLSATHDNQRLFVLIAQSKVGQRPGRIEPRMQKRPPKPYPWLKEPRIKVRRRVQRHGHALRPK